jgi:hypothetical protein
MAGADRVALFEKHGARSDLRRQRLDQSADRLLH